MPSWIRRGDYREGRERLAAALSRAPHAPGLARAWGLRACAMLASQQSDLAVADGLGYEALALFRELGDQRGVGWTLHVLGWNAMARGDYGEARRLWEEAADAHSGPGDEQLQRRALMSLAGVESLQGDHARAVSLLRDVVASTRREGSPSTWRLHSATSASRRTSPERRSRRDGRSRRASRCTGRTPASRFSQSDSATSATCCDRPPRSRRSLTSARASRCRGRSRNRAPSPTASREAPGSSPRVANATNATTLLAAASAIRALTGAVSSPQQASHGRHPRGAVPRGALRRSVRPSMGGRRRARRHRCRRLGAPSLRRNRVAQTRGGDLPASTNSGHSGDA